jgi:methionyl-tRNA synthetase
MPKKSESFYITTTLPYVNGEPHIGFAMEIIRADVIARWKKSQGFEVFFNTGTDEHGRKISEAAQAAGQDTKAYVDGYAEKFRELESLLGLSDDIHFIRTTDAQHQKAAQEFWKIVDANGFIYKKNYKIKYCVGCELEKQDSELVDGHCPIHPQLTIELIEEENYFFKFSAFQQPLLDFYAKHRDFVVPDFRFNEIKSFVSRGLEDFSISRLKNKMSWGVPVPSDPDHVMYVWFDALVSYISTLGWPEDGVKSGKAGKGAADSLFQKFWKNGTPVQYCGKDNLRQQSAMWQAMLIAAGLPNSRHIVIDGFITGDGGIKMSKSLGNTVDPITIIGEYGTDALRYYLVREVSPFEDSPFTMEKFKESYNAHLANGLGNLVSRVVKMAETNDVHFDVDISVREVVSLYAEYYEKFELNKVCEGIWKKIQAADKFIQENEPFKKVKVDAVRGKADILYLLGEVAGIGAALAPILPDTSAKISQALKENKIAAPLFLRK